jgi:hypothetical protein
MAWPTAAELKRRLNIDSTDWDDHMDRLIAAGIAWVKVQVGDWDEDTDLPSDALAQSALERAVEMATTGEPAPIFAGREGTVTPTGKAKSMLYGHRRRFGIG